MNNFILVETTDRGSIIINETAIQQIRPFKDGEGKEYFQLSLDPPGPTGPVVVAVSIQGLGSLGQLLLATGYSLIEVPKDCEPK